MRQSSARTLIKGALFAILISMVFNLSAIPAGFAQATQLKVVAPPTDITVPAQFYIDITVVDIPAPPSALTDWQIKLYFNPTVLSWINGTFPPGHVFDGKLTSPLPAFKSTDAGGTYILMSNSLVGTDPPQSGFSGSGTLCRISFEAKTAGISTLVFSRPLGFVYDTFLCTWMGGSLFFDIPATLVDGSVNVVGADTRPPTEISLNIDESSTLIGDVGAAGVVISGAINVTVPDGTSVFLEYWDYSYPYTVSWTALATVSTISSQYSYTWIPTENGTVGVRSRWTGSSSYKPATSEESNLTISYASTYVGVKPKAKTVGLQNQALPTPVFTVNITITGVTDLREWIIKLKFNQTILAATEASLPTYNVFGADYTLPEATVNNSSGFVQIGARGSAASFNGSGILCQIKFQGIGAPLHAVTYSYGISDLEFDPGVTSLKDTPGEVIVFNWEQQPASEIRVETMLVQPSKITLDVASQITIGNNLAISGRITTTTGVAIKLRVNVTITYGTATMTERVLAIVKTDSNGIYSTTWNANATGTYTFKASWAGNDLYIGASIEKPVTVNEQTAQNGGTDITMYLIIGGVVAIVVIAVVALYLVKFRKRSETPVS